MLVAGIDIGSRTTKTLLLEDGATRGQSMIYTGPDSAAAARAGFEEALKMAGGDWGDVGYIVATGYGRIIVPFAQESITEIACHALGVHSLFPSARTVLDMGGQDCKAIRVNAEGNHSNFAMNEKCAAGTGRFLEVMAEVLNVPLSEIGPLSLTSQEEVKVSSTCTVFAKSEVAYLVRRGVKKSDILAALHEAISVRVYSLLKQVGIEKDFVITGGIARNIGVVRRVAGKVGLEPLVPPDPQMMGALGAALFAKEAVGRSRAKPTAG